MSLDATRWAWQQRDITAAQKLVLLSLADRAGEDHTAWPTNERLTKDTCLDRKTVLSALATLSLKGFIRDTGRRAGRTKQVKVWQLIDVEGRHNSTETGMLKESQKRDASTVPESGRLNSTETGTLSSSKDPENGTGKESQKRDTESTSIESNKETPLPPADAEGAEGSKEGEGKTKKTPKPRKPKPDYDGVVEAFNEILGNDLAEVRIVNTARKGLIEKMWNYKFSAKSSGDSVDFWRRYFKHVLRSKPLTGRKPGFDWRPGFDWLMKEKNIIRIIEGEFHQGEDIRDDLEEDGGEA